MIYVLLAAPASLQSAQAQFVIDGQLPSWGISFDEVHQALAGDLLDPRSAQYKGMSLITTPSGGVVCGWMNWRGENGAYGPFAAFYFKAVAGGVREAYVSSVGIGDEMDEPMVAGGCDTPVLQTGLAR